MARCPSRANLTPSRASGHNGLATRRPTAPAEWATPDFATIRGTAWRRRRLGIIAQSRWDVPPGPLSAHHNNRLQGISTTSTAGPSTQYQ
jgi:hypothetical protein